MGGEYRFAVHFDIANFYDCIRLDLLEKKIRKKLQMLHVVMKSIYYFVF
jgi:hypothetical protein